MTPREWYAKQAIEDSNRRAAVHEAALKERRASMVKDPGGFNPWEKKDVDDYFAKREKERQFDADEAYRNRELKTREKIAEFGMQGQRDAGATAAGFQADAAKYGADRTQAGIEAKAKNDLEIARQKAEAEKWIAGRNAEVADVTSKRESGYFDENGSYVPGSRVHQAQAQGESAAKVAAMNNETKLEQERIKAQAAEKKALLMRDSQIQKGLANSLPFLSAEEKEKLLTRAAALDMTPEDTSDYIEFLATRKKKGGQGTSAQDDGGTARTEAIRRRWEAQNAE